jgi:tight adherence protein C
MHAAMAPTLTALSVLLLGAAIRSRRNGFALRLLGDASARVPPRRRFVLARLGTSRLARRLGDTQSLRQRLVLAGRGNLPEQVLGVKVSLGIGTGLLAAGLSGAVPTALVLFPLVGIAAFRLPDLVLAREGRRRQQEIGSHVADLVEVLVATTEAGLSPPVALQRSVDVVRGPLGDELQLVAREIELGVPWRDALSRLVTRTDAPSLRRLVSALTRSQRLGASVSSALRALAEDVRSERRARAEETARRAPVKMLFPLVFLILPAFLLLTVGPAVLATLRSLH